MVEKSFQKSASLLSLNLQLWIGEYDLSLTTFLAYSLGQMKFEQQAAKIGQIRARIKACKSEKLEF